MPRLNLSGVVFLALGGALLWLGWEAASLIGRVLGYSAGVCFVALGIIYLLSLPALVFKADGRMRPVSFLVFWPYHLMSYASLIFFRGMRVKPFHQIAPGVYLGGWLFPWEEAKLKAAGIVSVLDMTCELGEVGFLRRSPTYQCLPVLDGTAPTSQQLQAAVKFIRDRLPEGPVYIHCAMGHGRSATVVAAYLLSTGAAADLPSAIKMMRDQRPGVRLNAGQRRAVENLIK